jgi:PAS domain S-box-containing protein
VASTLHSSEQARQVLDIRLAFDTIPTLAWSARSDGSADFFNQRWLDYTGLSAEQERDWGWTVALHSDDLNGLVDYWRSVLDSGEPGEIEGRLRRCDGLYRWFLFRATPSLDNDGKIFRWFGTNTDIEDQKRAESLLAGENLVLEMTAKGNSLESILETLCRRPSDCRYQPRFGGAHRFRNISRRPLLPAECFPDPRAASSEPKGRHSDAGRILREALRGEGRKGNQQDRQNNA